MKIRIERTGTFKLVPVTGTTKREIQHFNIDELINIAELCWDISNYKGDFRIRDEETGEIICTLIYEKPKQTPKGFSQKEIAQILVSATKNHLEELSHAFPREDAEESKASFYKGDGATNFALELLDYTYFGDPNMFAEKSYTDEIFDLWYNFSDKYEQHSN